MTTPAAIRIGVYVRAEDAIVCERRLGVEADIRIGREEDGAETFCPILGRRMNIRVREGISVLTDYASD